MGVLSYGEEIEPIFNKLIAGGNMDNFKLLRGKELSILTFGEYQTKLEKLDNNLLYIEIKHFGGEDLIITYKSEIIDMTGTFNQYEQFIKWMMPQQLRLLNPRITMRNFISLLTHAKFDRHI